MPPATSAGGREAYAIVRTALTPARESPSHRSERVTDWVLGEVLAVEEREGDWVRAAGPDGYGAWAPSAPLLPATRAAAEGWASAATFYSTGVGLQGAAPLARLPWGARVARDQRSFVVPGGETVVPDDPARLVEPGPWPRPADGPASAPVPPTGEPPGLRVARAALDWLDVPYVWGGRTELGVDCSGFVQSLVALYGVRLPRDSADQRDAGPEIAVRPPHGSPDEGGPEPGDLLFFAPEGKGITHVALVLEGGKIVHAAASNGRVAVDRLDGAPEDRTPLARRLADSIVACTRPLEGGG